MKIMMFAHDGSLNRGCEAIVRSSTSLIKEKINGAQVYLASGKPETDEMISKLDGIYDGSASGIKKYSYEWLFSAVKVKLFNDETYALGKIHNNIVKHIHNMDVCLSIGGDNYCYGEQPGWYEINRRVKAQGKKLVLWGCSIGPEDMSDRKLQDLKQFDLILARESLTYLMLKSKGLKNVKLCADSAFTMEKEELELPEGWQVGNTVGLNFSPLVWKRNKESQTAVKDLINHILSTTDMTIALTPHVMEDGNNDYEILHNYYEQFKTNSRVLLLPNHLNAIQYKGFISRMRFFVGARTHATIAAYSNFVPTMVLGYSVKSKGISKDIFGEEKLVLSIDEISNSSKLKSKFDEMVREEKEIRRKLQKSIPNIKKMSYKAVEYLDKLIQ
ncbi:polysaccharide pyruvyl transferase family protein [Paenibacillus radicis (ex Xue et al. 2023)]|uniref:Polysaccharide pyruvyl transferase family protein n=1 Tax=Paenibacillus radicis (ex Xue et al. 2023) TaxID=2972489 RepID=A0ABT1YRM3_9BACL|nr:polysaccharide pyruvyl transferase family protein [Paenibacillus radicis (ex Xue et al. 2023)]MCR8635390.1 polysaccharide pyruvyl transferase family protein [Paenibacillus radicis (ex Xue et al. 2023)]